MASGAIDVVLTVSVLVGGAARRRGRDRRRRPTAVQGIVAHRPQHAGHRRAADHRRDREPRSLPRQARARPARRARRRRAGDLPARPRAGARRVRRDLPAARHPGPRHRDGAPARQAARRHGGRHGRRVAAGVACASRHRRGCRRPSHEWAHARPTSRRCRPASPWPCASSSPARPGCHRSRGTRSASSCCTSTLPHVSPPPPGGHHPEVVLAAVVAERRRRDLERLWREEQLRARVLPADPLAPR